MNNASSAGVWQKCFFLNIMCSFEEKNQFCCFNSETKHSGLVIFSCTCMACGTERMRPVEMCCASSFRARARPKGYHHRGGVCGVWFIFAVYPCCWARETRRGSIQKRGHQKLWALARPYIPFVAGRPAGRDGGAAATATFRRAAAASQPPTTNEHVRSWHFLSSLGLGLLLLMGQWLQSLPCVVVSRNCGRKRHWGRQTDTGPTGGTDQQVGRGAWCS
jgi:hypothetical protein